MTVIFASFCLPCCCSWKPAPGAQGDGPTGNDGPTVWGSGHMVLVWVSSSLSVRASPMSCDPRSPARGLSSPLLCFRSRPQELPRSPERPCQDIRVLRAPVCAVFRFETWANFMSWGPFSVRDDQRWPASPFTPGLLRTTEASSTPSLHPSFGPNFHSESTEPHRVLSPTDLPEDIFFGSQQAKDCLTQTVTR